MPSKKTSDIINNENSDLEIISAEEGVPPLLPKPIDAVFEDESYKDKLNVTKELNEIITSQNKPKLYALLIGINNYPGSVKIGDSTISFPELRGCINDSNKIGDYLRTETFFDTNIKKLHDKDATKDAIVNLIKNHLGEASGNDTAFLYFSGHGTQEETDKNVFTDEPDGKLESIICHFGENTKSDFLLSDKELRWLIYGLSQKSPHIVTIFDCCHSGDNTRAVILKNYFPEFVEKKVNYVFPKRDWKKFIFGNVISEGQFLKEGVDKLLPEGFFFQFSACESDESAIELNREGVFTKVLLSVLKNSGGNITYQSLASRIRQYMRNVYEQKPKVYVGAAAEHQLNIPFLNKSISEVPSYLGEISFNETDGWQLNLGAIHGVTKLINRIQIFNTQNPSKLIDTQIGKINIDYSAIITQEELNEEQIYYAKIQGLQVQKCRIFFDTLGSNLDIQEKLFNALTNDITSCIGIEENESQSQYVLRFVNGFYFLTLPHDPYRPITEPKEDIDEYLVAKIVSDIKQISKWEFVKNLINQDEGSLYLADSVKIEIAIGLPPVDFKNISSNQKIDIDLLLNNNLWKNAIRIKMTNTGDKNLYCCILYLMANFASYSRYLNPPVTLLKPNDTVELNYKGNSIIEFSLDKIMKYYNLKFSSDYFKFIISTENFDTTTLDFGSLTIPNLPSSTGKRRLSSDRSAQNDYSNDQLNTEDLNNKGWITKMVEIRTNNPKYNLIKESDLNMMLNDEKTSDFAMGLYFETVDGAFSASYRLKPDIQIIEEAQRGIVSDKIIDIANWWSRRNRNKFFQESLEKFPNRIKIVSEGDSWFQHPLVLDIIDHLHRVYNIYCVAAAGDTLRNYFSNKKSNGEYFMDAIDKHNPAFFLVSGGGNDILGSQFRNYLVNNHENSVPAGSNPERFIKKELLNEMDSLMEIYKTTFLHIATHKPNLHIIVHGYDYPVKLSDAKKGWLGRYMIEKGINNPEDRKAIMHYIMDLFNNKISGLCSQFKNTVTYIDVRNIVRYNEKEKVDQWYDEIHPDNDGFQQIAMKFIQNIDRIYKASSSQSKP